MNDVQIIEVDVDTNNLDRAWQRHYKNKLINNIKELKSLELNTPRLSSNKLRLMCMSDTHTYTHDLINLPECDLFIHAGDFTKRGTLQQIKEFNSFLKQIKAKEKVVICGNHELTFQSISEIKCKSIRNELYKLSSSSSSSSLSSHKSKDIFVNDPRKYLTNCIYLQDELVELFGLKIYGSPWQPFHRGWAFNAQRGHDLLQIWNRIPSSCDILVTHGPPAFIGDLTSSLHNVGCLELLNTVQKRVKPKLHIFGHVHESHGVWTDSNDTIFINASICNSNYKPTQLPILIDIDKPL